MMSQLRHASNLYYFNRYFDPKRKKRYIISLLFLFYPKGGNLEAASLACISYFLTRTLDEMIKALKMQQLNGQELGLMMMMMMIFYSCLVTLLSMCNVQYYEA